MDPVPAKNYMMTCEEVILNLHKLSDPKNVAGMARFGIVGERVLGISIYDLRALAKKIGKNHQLAAELWRSGIHEARIIAGFIEEPEKVTEAQAEEWVKDLESWDMVDQVSDVFTKTPFVVDKIEEWSRREEEFVKRTAYAMIAEIAWRDKNASDETIASFFPIIKRGATDERNFVKKAVNWALRNIGKRNKALNKRAIEVAKEIQGIDSKSARWIAADALRELTSEKIQNRLKP